MEGEWLFEIRVKSKQTRMNPGPPGDYSDCMSVGIYGHENCLLDNLSGVHRMLETHKFIRVKHSTNNSALLNTEYIISISEPYLKQPEKRMI